MMQLVLFSKTFKGVDGAGLVKAAHEYGLEGYDLCVRPEHAVNPDNVAQALPEVVKLLAGEGFSVPMVTAPTELVSPDEAWIEPLLSAMSEGGIGLLKLGYVGYDPAREDYWAKVDEFRQVLSRWEKLAQKHGVKILYHTHSGGYLGLNCAALMHLLRGFDPRHIGAYIDPAHMTIDGEPFAVGAGMVREYLLAVGLKDTLISRWAAEDEGRYSAQWVPAGEGSVAWSEVFKELVRIGFDGPLSVHAEYRSATPEEHLSKLRAEVAYFRRKRDAVAG